jgi:hypothetical protein
LCAPPTFRVAFALRVRSHAHHCVLRLGSLVLKGHPFLLTRRGQTRQAQGRANQWMDESQRCPEKNACTSLYSRNPIRSLCLALTVSRLRLMCAVHVWPLSFGVGPDWGVFDALVCPGVYSGVESFTQYKAINALCRTKPPPPRIHANRIPSAPPTVTHANYHKQTVHNDDNDRPRWR